MSWINRLKRYPARNGGQKIVFVLCGFGGSIWQTRRLVSVLQQAGYRVVALDFPNTVLSKGDPAALPALMDEVHAWAEHEAEKAAQPILLVGISLGALISLNLLRRSAYFTEGILITGGDIVRVAQNIYGPKVWPQPYEALAEQWRAVNMYTEPEKLSGKRVLFVLPTKDRLIDTEEVRREAMLHQRAGNKVILIERGSFGHIGTIVSETVLFPRRVLAYIEQVAT